ncbi:MAG: hypothetical protein P8Z75_12455 [Gammaproteobacteria bacterium]|jgi:hypothetical protein
MLHLRLGITLGIGLLALSGISQAVEQRDMGISQTDGLYLTTGLEYQSGDYGTGSTTNLWTVPVGVDYYQGRLSAGIYGSLMHAKSDGVIITSNTMGGHMTSVSSSSTRSTSVTGIGDVNLYASYRLATPNEDEISYHVTGRLKLGTADADKGLGTGQNDYAIEGGMLTTLQSMFVFANIGYQISGDSATINYHNVWYANGGALFPLNDRRSVGAMLEVSQAMTPGFDAPAQLTLFLNQSLADQRSLYFYLLLGLSNGSPDSGVGVNLTLKL